VAAVRRSRAGADPGGEQAGHHHLHGGAERASRAADRRLRLRAADRAHRAVRAGARAAARSAHPRCLPRRTGRMTHDPGPSSLAELEARLRRDLELLVLPPNKDWLEPRTHPDHGGVLDVAVIGAGMSGLAAAFALKCLTIRSLRMFDRSPEGFE